MKFTLALSIIASSWASGLAFIPAESSRFGRERLLFSAVETDSAVEVASQLENSAPPSISSSNKHVEIKSRLEQQLERLREKDSKSPKLNKSDIKVLFEDDHVIVVDKPSGVLCVPGKDGFHNLAQAVYESIDSQLGSASQMVVHRLGMDTSGIVIFAKSLEAVRGMNSIFRTRKIERNYEALVCGHVEKEEGMINLPLMRDYENPPFMRISTDDHQRVVMGLDPAVVGKKLLEAPKDSLTKFKVVSREEYEGHPVTRISLTSISGRTHQLNVHLAAFGHPIVGDTTYGINGAAAPNGGLSDAELESLVGNASRADVSLQQSLATASSGKRACIHAKSLKFRHPITKETVSLNCDSPF